MKDFLVLKGIFCETTYLCVLTHQFEVPNIVLLSFRQKGEDLTPPPTKRTPQKPTQIKVKSVNLIYHRLFKPIDAYIHLKPKSCHPAHMIKKIPKSQFLRLRKICSDTSDYIKKSNATGSYLHKTW